MSKIIEQYSQQIAKGTVLILCGVAFGMLFGFVCRVLLARYFSPGEYGLYSLALVLLSIFAIIGTLGLQEGLTRQIAYYRGRGEEAKIPSAIFSSLFFPLLASLVLGLALFFAADTISIYIFHAPGLTTVIRIFSLALPFSIFLDIFASIFRGFDEVKPRIYFQDILRNVLFLVLLGLAILLTSSFTHALYAFLASMIVSCLVFGLYTFKRLPSKILPLSLRASFNPTGRNLLLFSLPLLGVTILDMAILWIDTLMLGYFKTSEAVGVYNAALPISQLITLILGSMGFIYVPVLTQLYSRNLMADVKRVYQVTTKWAFSASLPLFLVIVFFPEAVLTILFGASYAVAATALRVLSLGFILHVSFGMNGMSLLAMGQSRFLMWASLAAVFTNIILNMTLIPAFGIVGAAIATALSAIILNLLRSARLFQLARIHPFTKNYLKPMLASAVALLIVYVSTTTLLSVSQWMLPIFLVVFLLIYVLSTLLTRSFDQEDIALLLAIERRMGINLKLIKKVVGRFL